MPLSLTDSTASTFASRKQVPRIDASANRTSPTISLVLPGYNEEKNVQETVRKCLQGLRAATDVFEILIINDGSTDGTAALAEQLAQEHPQVRVVHNPINLGVGASVWIGMRAARHDLVLHNAMDYPFDLTDLERVLPLFPDWDVVVLARKDRSAHAPFRKLTSFVYHWLIRLLFGVKLHDLNFVQVYKREVLQSVTVKARSPAFVTPELLIRAADQGFAITEVRASFHPRRQGTAHYGKCRDILWALADMVSFWWERKPRKASS